MAKIGSLCAELLLAGHLEYTARPFPHLFILSVHSSTMLSYIGLILCASAFAHETVVQRSCQEASPFSITNASSTSTRASALAAKRAGWQYGPSVAGNTAFYPAGSIGGPATKAVLESFSAFLDVVDTKVVSDSKASGASIVAVCVAHTINAGNDVLTNSRRAG